jgi:hypothetical protein
MKTFLFCLCLLLLPLLARSGEMTAATFSTMLENATLEGTWAPVAGERIGEEKADRYQIARAVVKFAGDVAVLVLDEVPVGDGATWSARVMFHDGVYTGRWWNAAGKGGTVSGIIRKS